MHSVRVAIAFVLILLSSSLICLYVDFGMRYGSLVGLDSKDQQLATMGRGCLLSIGASIALQSLSAWAMVHRTASPNDHEGESPSGWLLRIQSGFWWKDYFARFLISIGYTIVCTILLLALMRANPSLGTLHRFLFTSIEKAVG
jgi:hypothetical protein